MVGVVVSSILVRFTSPTPRCLPLQRNQACSVIEAEGRGAQQRALGRLEGAAIIVQARLARGCAGRAVAHRARELREVARAHAKTSWAVSLLQTRCCGRGYMS